ncbi:hypothetical protein HDU67_008643 [Dinochytrium kinnereticum]|nr:hypothetical protein HDU67_008643 [Dinochytrium kinnereticum]
MFISIISSAILLLVSAATSTAAYDFPYGTSDVSVVNTSHTERLVFATKFGSKQFDYNFKVLLAVKNKAFEKEVGIRYTNDSWATYSEALATYTQPLDNDYELWTVSLYRGSFWSYEGDRENEVAGFVSYNKDGRVWDPRNNYYIYKNAVPQAPITFLRDSVSLDAASDQINLEGSVRTYSANRIADYQPGSLKIRWTINDWETFTDSPAVPTASNDTWSWKFPVTPAKTDLPISVSYAIQYKPSTISYWINNDSKNYQKKLRPTYTVNYNSTIFETPLTGIARVPFYFNTDLPLGVPKGRVDGGEFSAFEPSFWLYYNINTTTLDSGVKHVLDVSVPAEENGPEVFKLSLPFSVIN